MLCSFRLLYLTRAGGRSVGSLLALPFRLVICTTIVAVYVVAYLMSAPVCAPSCCCCSASMVARSERALSLSLSAMAEAKTLRLDVSLESQVARFFVMLRCMWAVGGHVDHALLMLNSRRRWPLALSRTLVNSKLSIGANTALQYLFAHLICASVFQRICIHFILHIVIYTSEVADCLLLAQLFGLEVASKAVDGELLGQNGHNFKEATQLPS